MTSHRPDASLPLLAAQRQQWLSHRDDPSSPRYNCGGYFRITGGPDRAALAAAVTAAYAETDALRVVFDEVDGRPQQMVVERSPALLRLVLPDENAAIGWMTSSLVVPFDLRCGGDVSSHTIIETSSGDVFFFFHYHHIVLDAYGAHRYLQRVIQHYNALVTGVPAPRSGFVGLTDLIAEETAYRDSAKACRDDEYWRRVLATPLPWSALAPSDLPARPRPLRSVECVSDDTRSAFSVLSARTGARWPVVIQAAMACVLSETTGSRDVVLGMLAANRSTLAAVKTPTNMANELPLRIAIPADGSFTDLLDQAAGLIGEATTHQRAQLSHGSHPIALRTFVNVIAFGGQPELSGCTSEFHVLATGPASNFRVNCYSGAEDDLLLEFEVNPAIYDVDELARHQKRILDLLHDLVVNPESRLRDVLRTP